MQFNEHVQMKSAVNFEGSKKIFATFWNDIISTMQIRIFLLTSVQRFCPRFKTVIDIIAQTNGRSKVFIYQTVGKKLVVVVKIRIINYEFLLYFMHRNISRIFMRRFSMPSLSQLVCLAFYHSNQKKSQEKKKRETKGAKFIFPKIN